MGDGSQSSAVSPAWQVEPGRDCARGCGQGPSSALAPAPAPPARRLCLATPASSSGFCRSPCPAPPALGLEEPCPVLCHREPVLEGPCPVLCHGEPVPAPGQCPGGPRGLPHRRRPVWEGRPAVPVGIWEPHLHCLRGSVATAARGPEESRGRAASVSQGRGSVPPSSWRSATEAPEAS